MSIPEFDITDDEQDYVLCALVSEWKDRGCIEDDKERSIHLAVNVLKLATREEFLQFIEQGAVTLDDAREELKS